MANGEPSGATGCDCSPPATTVNKVFDVGFDDWNEDVDKDPTSKEFMAKKKKVETELAEAVSSDATLLDKGMTNVFVKSFTPKSGSRKRRSTDGGNSTLTTVEANTAIQMAKPTNASDVDGAFKNTNFSKNQDAIVANPCFKENITDDMEVPEHLVLEENAPDVYQSGFYAHLICKREAGSDKYKKYHEAGEKLQCHCKTDVSTEYVHESTEDNVSSFH